MGGERAVAQSIIGELQFSDVQGVQRNGGNGVTRIIINEVHSWDIEAH